MAEESYSYMFLLIVLFGAGCYMYRLVEVRLRYDALIQKYKPGTRGYGIIQKLRSPWHLLITSLALIASLILLVVDVYTHKHMRDFIFIGCFVLTIILTGFAITPTVLKGSSPKRK
jgi:hypothetical protein